MSDLDRFPLAALAHNHAALRGGALQTTWNAADKSANIALSNGNLTATRSGGAGIGAGVRATTSKSSGKWYFEVTITFTGGAVYVGIANAAASLASSIGTDANGISIQPNGIVLNNGGAADFRDTYTTGQVVGIAVDLGALKFYPRKNDGTWSFCDPVAGTGGISFASLGAAFPAFASSDNALGHVGVAAFTAASLAHAAPTGYTAWGG